MIIRNNSRISLLKILILIILTFFIKPSRNYSQIKNFQNSPLKQCQTLRLENPLYTVSASDNESIIILESGGSIKSYNIKIKQFNWVFNLGGNFLAKPFVSGKNVFVVTEIYENNEQTQKFRLYSISQKTGVTNWSKFIENTTFEKSGNMSRYSYVNVSNNTALFFSGQKIFLISLETGEIVWESPEYNNLTTLPDFFDEQIYFGNSKKFVNVISPEENNFTKFKVKIKPSEVFIDERKKLYLSDDAGQVFASSLDGKKSYWSLRLGGRATNFLETDGNLLITSLDNFIYLVSNSDGKIIWRKRLGGRIINLPLLQADMVIVSSFGEPYINFLNIKNGQIINRLILPVGEFLIDTPVYTSENFVFLTLQNLYVYQGQKCL